MTKKGDDQKGNQQGPQQHAEGQQGEKTRRRFQEQLHSGEHHETAHREAKHPNDGGHRLFEQREQHDEADLNSEKNRLNSDIEVHGHDRENFQVQGGAKNVRVESRHAINPGDPDAPQPGAPDGARPARVPGKGAS
jgi:hypothetical protein